MSFNPDQFKNEIIVPTLDSMDMLSDDAVNLLMGTMAQESHFGTYVKQVGGGPALGPYQMEPNTHDDIVKNYIEYREPLMSTLGEMGYWQTDSRFLKYDLKYATIFARLHYLRQPAAIPSTVEGYAKYWKKYYNTPQGKGNEQEFIDNYARFIGDV